MPAVRYHNVQLRLNLDTPEGSEIAEGLARYPEGDRSRAVREALLAYFRSSKGQGERRLRKSSSKPPTEQQVGAAQSVTQDSNAPLPEKNLHLLAETEKRQQTDMENKSHAAEPLREPDPILAKKAKALFNLIK